MTRPAVTAISEELRKRVAKRLGLDLKLTNDAPGIYTLYAAWCRNVPFDNVRKLIALRTGATGTLPGMDASDFLENFLEHGTGGTCWSSSNALFELVVSYGFTARRIAGSMRDLGVPGHGTIKVTVREMDWIVDSSMLSMYPIPITNDLYIYRDALFGVEVEPSDGTQVVWFNTPPYEDYFPCRLLIDPVTYEFYAERYEISRTKGPFNHHLSVRYNRGDARTVIQGHTRHRVTAAHGLESRELTREELVGALRNEVGMSEGIVKRWVDCGALEAAYEPPLTPPGLLTNKPPSTRGH